MKGNVRSIGVISCQGVSDPRKPTLPVKDFHRGDSPGFKWGIAYLEERDQS